MKLSKLIYLLSFFAPVAFLLGYIAGAPRPIERRVEFDKIDSRSLPVSPIDFYKNESSMVVAETDWIQPNSKIAPR